MGLNRNLDDIQQRMHDAQHISTAANMIEQHDKFIAAKASHLIVGTQTGADSLGHRHQDTIALKMPQRIVDAFEIVQINEQQRQ